MTALVSFDRVFEVLDLKPLIEEKPGAVAMPRTMSGNGSGPPGHRVHRRLVPLPGAADVSLASLESVARAGADGRGAEWSTGSASWRRPES